MKRNNIGYRIGFLPILLVLLLSCGSRKTKTQTEKREEKTEQETRERDLVSEASQAKIDTKNTLNLSELGFSVTPLEGVTADFSLWYRGEEIRGRTTGKMDFNESKKTEVKETKEVRKDSVFTEKTKALKIKYKSVEKTKAKETEREDGLMVYIGVFVAGALCWELLRRRIFK